MEQQGALGHAYRLIRAWQNEDPTLKPEPILEDVIANCCQHGNNAARVAWAWRKTLEWPQEAESEGPGSWGVTWFELYVNYNLITRKYMPIERGTQLLSSRSSMHMTPTKHY